METPMLNVFPKRPVIEPTTPPATPTTLVIGVKRPPVRSSTMLVGLRHVSLSCTEALLLELFSGMIDASGLFGDACHIDGVSDTSFEEMSSTFVTAPAASR